MIDRKPVSSARECLTRYRIEQQDPKILSAEWADRLLALTRKQKIGIVLCEQGRFYISDNPFNPWGSKEYISIPDLQRLIEKTEKTEAAA